MKSWHYISIFVAILAIIGGVILFNASSIRDIDTEITKSGRSGNEQESVATQEEIDVLADVDFESDALDAGFDEDFDDFDDVDELFAEEAIAF